MSTSMKTTMILSAVMFSLVCGPNGRAAETASEVLLANHGNRDAYTPGVAYGKDVFLTVWQSGRVAEGDIRKGLNFNGDIAGCRVDKTGRALDATPFVICGAKDLQERPRVVFGGDVFLVVWQDLRNGKDWDVYAARVAPDGKVLDPDGILVSGAPRSQATPRASWDGKVFQVVWQDIRSGVYEIYGARVSAGGKVLDQEGECISPKLPSGYLGQSHWHSPVIGSAGQGRSLAVWASYHVNARCFIVDGKELPGSAKQQKVEGINQASGHGPNDWANATGCAAGPDSYMGVWRTWRPCSRGVAPAASQGAIFSQDGERIKNVSVGSARIVDPDVAWDGSAFIVAWSEYDHRNNVSQNADKIVFDRVRCSRITPAGDLIGQPVDISGSFAGPASQAAVASDGSGTSLIAYEKHPETGDIPIKIGCRILSAK